MNTASKQKTTFNPAHLHSYKTSLCWDHIVNWNVLWIWATDSETVKGWTHVVDLTPLCSATPDPPPSIHLLPRLGLFVAGGYACGWSTMSEHMQLSLALCRIGLYTVRKKNCIHAAVLCDRERLGCVVLNAGMNTISFTTVNLPHVVFWKRYWPRAAAASPLLGHWKESICSVSFEWVLT